MSEAEMVDKRSSQEAVVSKIMDIGLQNLAFKLAKNLLSQNAFLHYLLPIITFIFLEKMII